MRQDLSTRALTHKAVRALALAVATQTAVIWLLAHRGNALGAASVGLSMTLTTAAAVFSLSRHGEWF